ncbi:GerAB/ArcD/ProY family transporter [Paenibacillus sp. MMS18-CY102]|uniref:GerAB/ArcD/ProY family transporter n=1 Tax=Paenibacillus sp. MMS18-CY102 TaxID=2682849 RepID=UPI00136521A3|nr:GerAB/ArcD/ProY family transporter [Paenibacillus sp. MMS18-CY102]
MEQVRISRLHFFMLIGMYLLGGTIALGTGVGAGKDVWLAILLGLVPGLLLYAIYAKLYFLYPDKPLTSYLPLVLGNPIGKTVAFLYSVHFIYQATRNIRGCGNLLVISVYDQTPLFAMLTLMALALIYLLYYGIETISRSCTIFLSGIVGLGFMASIFLLASGVVDMNRLLPVMENGWKPVLSSVPSTFFLPFEEMIVITMLFPYVAPKGRKSVLTGMWTMVTTGFVLAYTMALNVAVLGSDLFMRSVFPLLSTTSQINIGDFIQKVDAIAISTLMLSYFFKGVIYAYIAAMAIADLWQVQIKQLALPVGFIVLFSCMMLAGSYSENYVEGFLLNPYVIFPFDCIIPAIVLAVALIRRRLAGASSA